MLLAGFWCASSLQFIVFLIYCFLEFLFLCFCFFVLFVFVVVVFFDFFFEYLGKQAG